MKAAPMSIRLTPHILSVADWSNPYTDPIRRQFIPLKSAMRKDHPALSFDSLHETEDSPVPGLVHRYPDKVLFLGEMEHASEAGSADQCMQPLLCARSTAAFVLDPTLLAAIQNL
jgi:lysine 2,3-aminomutase